MASGRCVGGLFFELVGKIATEHPGVLAEFPTCLAAGKLKRGGGGGQLGAPENVRRGLATQTNGWESSAHLAICGYGHGWGCRSA